MTLVAAVLGLFLLPCGEFVAHARHYAGGADRKASVLAEHAEQAGLAYGLNPFLLIAHGKLESSLDGTKIGKLGEVSLMQFMPNTRSGREYTRFRGTQEERDGLAMLLGAELLRQGLDECGSEAAAIGWYKSGHCIVGPKARATLALRDSLRPGGDP